MKMDPKITSISNLMSKAKTDSERFAVLLIITKKLDISSMNNEDKNNLYQSIGYKFPIRLLRTAVKDLQGFNNEDKLFYASIGISVLHIFNQQIKNNEAEINILNLVCKVLCTCINGKFNNHKENEILLMQDCLKYGILLLGSQDDNELLALNIQKILTTICDALPCQHNEVQSLLYTALLTILEQFTELSWSDGKNILNCFITKICSKMSNDASIQKFETLKRINNILAFLSINDLGECEWKDNAVKSVIDILSSKVNSMYKHYALSLAYHLVSLFGIEIFVSESKGNKFILLLVRLSCIEAKLWLEENLDNIESLDQNSYPFIVSWCGLIEAACSKLQDFENENSEFLNFDDIQKIQPSLEEVMNLVNRFIKNLFLQNSENQILISTLIRVMGSWLCIENHTYSKTGFDFIPTVCKVLLYINKHQLFHLLKFILPSVMLYIEDLDSFLFLMKEKILNIFNKILLKIPFNNATYCDELKLLVQCMFGVRVITNTSESIEYDSATQDILTSILNVAENQINAAVLDSNKKTLQAAYSCMLYVSTSNMLTNSCSYVQISEDLLLKLHKVLNYNEKESARIEFQDDISDILNLTRKEISILTKTVMTI